MTKKQCMKNIKYMINQGAKKYLIEESERLLRSGGIDISEEKKEHFLKAKCILYVACLNLADQYKPVYKENLEDARNLMHF